jgi:hypothetical protein
MRPVVAKAVWSDSEPEVEVNDEDRLAQLIDYADVNSEVPTTVSIEIHGYRSDLLVGHPMSFVHMSPDDKEGAYFITLGGERRTVRFLAQRSPPYSIRAEVSS